MKRIILFIITLSFILVAVAKDSYYPTCVVDREYIYTNGNDTIKINTRPSQEKREYIIFNEWNEDLPPYTTILKDSKSQILRDYEDMYFSDGLLAKFKENFSTIGNDVVYFDYNLQIDDTLSVMYFFVTAAGYYEHHRVHGKIIKVLSIDTAKLQSKEVLKYNLRSKDFEVDLWSKFDEYPNRPPDNYTYHYVISEKGEPYDDAWIEGVGYIMHDENNELQCVFEKGELIYCAEGAKCDGLSDNANEKIDFAALTLHREGDHIMAVFPAVGVGEAVTLYDTTGRVVASQPLRQGATTATIDIAHLPQGVYITRVGNTLSAKVVL